MITAPTRSMHCLYVLRLTCTALILSRRRGRLGQVLYKIIRVMGKLPLTLEW